MSKTFGSLSDLLGETTTVKADAEVAPTKAAPKAPAKKAAPAAKKAAPKASAEAKTSPAPAKVASAKKPAQPPAETSDVIRSGIYFQPEVFAETKGAYLADWRNGGEADTFTRWIAAAIEAHAALTPAQRAKLGRPEARGETRGITRTFNLPSSTIAKMREAKVADQGVDRWLSDSSWCGEAVEHAVNAARERNGGTLPTPPSRLPNRLTR